MWHQRKGKSWKLVSIDLRFINKLLMDSGAFSRDLHESWGLHSSSSALVFILSCVQDRTGRASWARSKTVRPDILYCGLKHKESILWLWPLYTPARSAGSYYVCVSDKSITNHRSIRPIMHCQGQTVTLWGHASFQTSCGYEWQVIIPLRVCGPPHGSGPGLNEGKIKGQTSSGTWWVVTSSSLSSSSWPKLLNMLVFGWWRISRNSSHSLRGTL